MPQNLLPSNGEVFYHPDFFSLPESARYFLHLLHDIPWKQEPIKIFGKEIMQPRLTALYGDGDKTYGYSGIVMQPQQWTSELLEIKNRVEAEAGQTFHVVLLNLYRDGKDSMGWHRDNEKELGRNPVVASVSFGATRRFLLREYKGKANVQTIEPEHGSLLIMKGESQHHWEHSLPKTSTVVGPRINLTFRTLKGGKFKIYDSKSGCG